MAFKINMDWAYARGKDRWRKWMDVSTEILYQWMHVSGFMMTKWLTLLVEFVLIISASQRLFPVFLPIVTILSCSVPFLNHCISLTFFYLSFYIFPTLPWFSFLFLGAVLCSQDSFFLRTRSWKAIHGFFNETLLHLCASVCEREGKRDEEQEIKRGKGIPGAGLQYHLYANLLRLW